MKLSKYNIISKRDNYTYWFNSYSRKFFKLTSSIADKIYPLLEKGEWESAPGSFIGKLKEGGFIVDKDLDETKVVVSKSEDSINSKHYFLIILPTLNCNYHCWYCIQNHIESKMSEETIERIKRHIDYMIEVEKIESLHLDWFGGEPFLYFKEVILPLSTYAQRRCKEAGIYFMSGSTTNGYFLSEGIIEECDRLDFRQFQITLDGNQRFHDKVKFQKGCESTFAHVLKNINNIITLSMKAYVFLRINYTRKNLSDEIVEEVNKYILPDNRSRIVITPRKVWQETVDEDFHLDILDILDKFREAGYGVEYWNPANNFIPCYANKKYYNAISFNGKVVKCTACDDLYDNDPKGELLEDGRIVWIDGFDKKYQEKTYDNEKCLDCNKLPICMGLCPREHVNGHSYCKEDVMSVSFENSIVSFMDRACETV